MFFSSENWAGAHPAVTAALAAHAPGFASAYGTSDLDRAVHARFCEIFEREVSVFYVSTGTAANALSLASLACPGGVVFAHADAHLVVTECGAPEYLSAGQLRLATVGGAHGKIDPAGLRRRASELADGDVHGGRPVAVSVSQSTESGGVYSLAELDAVAAVARQFGLAMHMDGARFANSLVALGCSPADMTWRRGVDVLSFGATKNGCWCAEAVVMFNLERNRSLHKGRNGVSGFEYVMKRSAQLFSKTRFVSAQLMAYFTDGLWMEVAREANAMAKRLAEAFEGVGAEKVRLVRSPQTSEVFTIVSNKMIAALRKRGAIFCEWPATPDHELGDDEQLCRFVTCFATTDEHISQFRRVLRESANELEAGAS